jgi:hypothetical protein
MSTKINSDSQTVENDQDRQLYSPIKRRSFFKYAGATAGATALVLAGCSKNDSSPGMVNVGTGDAGVLNYAYALEQLEAAFYTQVRMGAYYMGTSITAAEKAILDDLYYHEVIHRDFLQAAITKAGATPIKALTPDFSAVNFATKAGVFGTAKAFEDLGVAAYNGAGRRISSPNNLVIAGKIVSVEARHAAIIRDIVSEGTFVGSDVVTVATTSIEISKDPATVVATANTFLAEGSKLDVSGIQ